MSKTGLVGLSVKPRRAGLRRRVWNDEKRPFMAENSAQTARLWWEIQSKPVNFDEKRKPKAIRLIAKHRSTAGQARCKPA